MTIEDVIREHKEHVMSTTAREAWQALNQACYENEYQRDGSLILVCVPFEIVMVAVLLAGNLSWWWAAVPPTVTAVVQVILLARYNTRADKAQLEYDILYAKEEEERKRAEAECKSKREQEQAAAQAQRDEWEAEGRRVAEKKRADEQAQRRHDIALSKITVDGEQLVWGPGRHDPIVSWSAAPWMWRDVPGHEEATRLICDLERLDKHISIGPIGWREIGDDTWWVWVERVPSAKEFL
jgi:membrane protein implicated in regulation of membrane protease activity